MFDKISDAAEKLAGKVSRRDFFGSLGRWAGAAALGVAGLLVSGKEAEARGKNRLKPWCCVYACGSYYIAICSTECPPDYYGCALYSYRSVRHCKNCYI